MGILTFRVEAVVAAAVKQQTCRAECVEVLVWFV